MPVAFALIALLGFNLLFGQPLGEAKPTALINCSGSIQACIDAVSDGDTILIAAGRYTDLDGNMRPHGPGFDIGAYEYATVAYLYLPLILK
jgi:hypothetical protein